MIAMGAEAARGDIARRCVAYRSDERSIAFRRPAQTLLTREAWCAMAYGCLTLPFTTPAVTAVPEWVQLLGLALLTAVPGLRLACWRAMIAAGLRSSRRAASSRLDEQDRDERRVRRGGLLIIGATVALLPIPPTWVPFWFALGVTTTALALVTLLSQHRRSPPTYRRNRCPRRRRSPAR